MNQEHSTNTHKRHCMVVHAYYPIGETRVERQAQALLTQGTEVDLICLRHANEPAYEIVDGVAVYRLPVKRHPGGLVVRFFEYLSFFVLAFIRLAALHLRRHYGVVQIHNLPDFLVFAALIPKLTGARVILDLHDLMTEFHAERFAGRIDHPAVRVIRWQEWLSCRFADHIITVTELWRQTLIGRKQPADKITVVMNVADDRIFNRQAIAAAAGDSTQSKADGDGRLELFYHGTVDQRYGLDLAIRAVYQIQETAPGVHLTIHGGGEHLQTLKNLVEELGLQERVHFSTQFVPTSELPRLIMKADLGVVPYRDGVFTGGILPTKLMEYAALGIPAIAAHTPAVAAYFDESTIQLFTPGDVDELAACILKLYRDPAQLGSLAASVGKFNARYNWPNEKQVYLQLVNRLATRKG